VHPLNPTERPWHRLEALPRTLWLPTLVASVGHAEAKLADVARWREALLNGEAPPADALLGDATATTPLREALGELGLPALCRASDAMTEQVLRTLLWHLDRIADHQPRLSREAAIAQVTADFRATWTVEKAGWDDVLALLQGLGDLAHLRWDELRGHPTRREWQEAQRIGERLAQMPEITALLRRIGRAQHAPAAPVAQAPSPEAAPLHRLLGLRAVVTRLPDAPGEITGIRHSDRLEGMLASEAAQIRHPVLHKLWRARRAEGRLLTWDSEAVLVDLRSDPLLPPRAAATPPCPDTRERGPIILCLDTSGSMRGAPEHIAKAVALAAFRTAHREQRACKLVAFGGPDEVLERDLSLDADGLAALLDLMGQSFDGGTDVQVPIARAIAAVCQAGWASADLLIVSDGEFGCTPATLAELDAAREQLGLRVQGVLVGDRETLGLLEACDEIHWVRDWRRHGDDRGLPADFSPVHSKSLTALYFPNALSARASRHRPA
jgi:uncharacterized protein with von Willebrand factor type A (vWA) domain